MLIKDIKKHFPLYTMLLPTVIFFIIFSYIPMAGIVLAFKDYKFNEGIWGSPWVGFKYFTAFFSSYDSGILIRNTLIIGFIQCVFEFPFAIIFALMINEVRRKKVKNFIQTISYLPYFFSWVIVITIVQRILAPDSGLLNQLIKALGGSGETFFMMEPKYFYQILVSVDLWKHIGWSSILYLAAMSGVDPTLYEAADIDGCGKLRKMWYITLPSISATIGILFILGVGGILSSGFDQIYLLKTPGTQSIANTLGVYVVRQGLLGGQYGYAAAVGLIQGVVGFILVIGSNYISKKVTEISIW